MDATGAAFPLELALPFVGVILLTPVYSSERDNGILDTIRARKTPYGIICGLRLILAAAITVIIICGFTFTMAALESDVTAAHALASCANAFFLGGLGALAAAVSGNSIIGYMVPVLYFAADMMGGFGSLTIFTMTRTGTTDGKEMIFLTGIICAAASLLLNEFRVRK